MEGTENMSGKSVRAVNNLYLDRNLPPVRILKGMVYNVEDVVENCIILHSDGGPSFLVDMYTFEHTFEAMI